MVQCQDWPCCGHELGCCPRFSESGEQLDMVCTCGARLPINNPTSICNHCLHVDEEGNYDDSFIDCDEDRDDYDDHDCYEDEVDGPEDEFLDSEWEDRLGGGE